MLLLRWSQWNYKGLRTRKDCIAEKAVCVTLVIRRSLNCTSACGLLLLLMLFSLPFYYTQIGRYLIRWWRSYFTFLYSDDKCVSLSLLSVTSEAHHIKCGLFLYIRFGEKFLTCWMLSQKTYSESFWAYNSSSNFVKRQNIFFFIKDLWMKSKKRKICFHA